MKKKRLLILVGAGASIEFGMPSVCDIDNILSDAAKEYFTLTTKKNQNLYTYLRDEQSRYRREQHALSEATNFEDVLFAIALLSGYFPAGLYTSPLGAYFTLKSIPEITYFDNLSKCVDLGVLQHLSTTLVDRVLDYIRERCRITDPNFSKLESFFAEIRKKFDVAVLSTNYDNLVYRALAPIETGFALNGLFIPQRILGRRTWSCMLHMHGSVHFDMDLIGSDLNGIKWQSDINHQFNQNSFGRGPHLTPSGIPFPTSVIVAGGHKTDQILRRPFRTYFSEMDRLFEQSDALLCCGFSFSDAHIRSAFAGFMDGRSRPVVIIDYAKDGTLMAGSGSDNRNLAVDRIIHMSGILPKQMIALGSTFADTVDKLKLAFDFQRSTVPGKRLSIWYNGMLSACENAAKIVAELS